MTCAQAISAKLGQLGCKVNSSMLKNTIINKLLKAFANREYNPNYNARKIMLKSLSTICQEEVSKKTKAELAVSNAESIFPSKVREWEESMPFPSTFSIPECESFNLSWYCKPDTIPGYHTSPFWIRITFLPT